VPSCESTSARFEKSLEEIGEVVLSQEGPTLRFYAGHRLTSS
jgi:hypothetical protein